MSLKGKNVFITGASKGIGRAIAFAFAREGANLVLTARSLKSLQKVVDEIAAEAQQAQPASSQIKTFVHIVNVQQIFDIQKAMTEGLQQLEASAYDILVNNAGLALGAPKPFWEQSIDDIDTMVHTNVSGVMYAVHAVLNQGRMAAAKKGTILNITSVTGLEVPPFPGEAVYHSSKAAQEGFTNVLRTELQGTNIRVLALRPGVVQGHFHEQRTGYDDTQYDDFMVGIEALVADDVAKAAVFMVTQPENISIKALDVVPSAQRSLQVMDRTWTERNASKAHHDKV